MGIAVAGEMIHLGEILSLSLRGEFISAGWTLVLDLYGLHHMLDTLNRLAGAMDFTASVWTWCFCFATSAAVTLRSRVVSSGDGPL